MNNNNQQSEGTNSVCIFKIVDADEKGTGVKSQLMYVDGKKKVEYSKGLRNCHYFNL